MNVILSSFKWQLALVSLDDIVIICKTTAQYIEHVYKVLPLLYNGGSILELKIITSSAIKSTT